MSKNVHNIGFQEKRQFLWVKSARNGDHNIGHRLADSLLVENHALTFGMLAGHGCQMVSFQTKIPIWVNFGGP
jgi:hypothetical protein